MTATVLQFYDCDCGAQQGDAHDMLCASFTPKLPFGRTLTYYGLRPHERFVRVDERLVDQLRAAPSEPVTVQIEDREGGELFMVFTRHDCPHPADGGR